MLEINNKIVNIFKQVQESTTSTQRSVSELKTLYSEAYHEEFLNIIKKMLYAIVSHVSGGSHIDRLIDFFCKYCYSVQTKSNNEILEQDDTILFKEILTFLLFLTNNRDKTVRLRSFQALKQTIGLINDAEKFLSQSSKISIIENCLDHLDENSFHIRKEVISCLYYFQDFEKFEIIEHFIDLMKDTHHIVRKFCVISVEITEESLKAILHRIRDVNEHVRLAAYEKLAACATNLKIYQRRSIIKAIIWEESQVVLKYIPTFLECWLKDFDDNIVELLKCLRFDANELDIRETKLYYKTVLDILFKKNFTLELPTNSDKFIPHEQLNWETSTFWRIFVQYIHENPNINDIENVLPNFISFCTYIKTYIPLVPNGDINEFLEYQHNLTELFTIIKFYDIADVLRREKLIELITYVLENGMLDIHSCQSVVNTLELLIPDNNERAEFILNTVMKIDDEEQENDESTKELLELEMKLKKLNNSKKLAIIEENYEAAENIKNEYESLLKLKEEIEKQQQEKDKPTTESIKVEILKIENILKIIAAFLNSPKITKITPNIDNLKFNFIFNNIRHDSTIVRNVAFRAYSRYCTLNKNDAENGIHLFALPIRKFYLGNECDPQLLENCVETVTDLLIIYGTSLIVEPAEISNESADEENIRGVFGDTSLSELIQAITQLMDVEHDGIRQTATRSICLLVFYERIKSASIISRLVLKWSNPLSEMDGLQVIISTYLKSFPEKVSLHDDIKESVLMTIEKIYYAPDSSPLVDVNIENVTKFMLALCKRCNEDFHKDLILKIFVCLINKPRRRINVFYSKVLSWMNINDEHLSDFKQFCEKIKSVPVNAEVAKNVIKFEKILSKKTKSTGDSSDNDSDKDDD